MVTFIEINKAFNDIATAHKQINSYGLGDPWEFATSGTVIYPVMWAKPEPSRVEQNVFVNVFTLIFADRVLDGEQNENDVISDMQQVALDVVALLADPSYSFDFKPFGQTLEPFTEGFTDRDAGVTLQVEIRCPYTASRCQVPQSGLTITGDDGATSGDASGTINVYLDGVLQSTTSSSDLDAETVNILWL